MSVVSLAAALEAEFATVARAQLARSSCGCKRKEFRKLATRHCRTATRHRIYLRIDTSMAAKRIAAVVAAAAVGAKQNAHKPKQANACENAHATR